MGGERPLEVVGGGNGRVSTARALLPAPFPTSPPHRVCVQVIQNAQALDKARSTPQEGCLFM